MGYAIAVYPLTLLNASVAAMTAALDCLKNGQTVPNLMDFSALQKVVGFKAYDDALAAYAEGMSASNRDEEMAEYD